MTDYLIGTGGWAYFKVPNMPSLKAYSEVFNFVEVNYTFYEYPDTRTVERWRRTVAKDFTFAVRCHQDLTHRIGLKPVSEAYNVLNKMTTYCRILDAPFLVLETPHSYVPSHDSISDARDLLSSTSLKGVRLVWEIRALVSAEAVKTMQDLDIVHCVDLSKGEMPAYDSDVLYSRLFGRGYHNVYQPTDEELVEIDKKAVSSAFQKIIMSFHFVRMYKDAARLKIYKQTGKFPKVTKETGLHSLDEVLSEDARFPASKEELIESQGWKLFDLAEDKRVLARDYLEKLSERTYNNVSDVIQTLRSVVR